MGLIASLMLRKEHASSQHGNEARTLLYEPSGSFLK